MMKASRKITNYAYYDYKRKYSKANEGTYKNFMYTIWSNYSHFMASILT